MDALLGMLAPDVVNPDKLAHLGPVSDVARLPESRPSPGGPAADGGA
jgi:hypothetical protein